MVAVQSEARDNRKGTVNSRFYSHWVWFSIWLAVVHIRLPCGSIGCGGDQYFMDIFVVEFDSARCSFGFVYNIGYKLDSDYIWIRYGRSNSNCIFEL